jgi:hypothetical protein
MMGDYGAGSGTASFAYNEDGLPPEYQGNLFLGDYARSQLMRLRVARDGGTYKIVSRETPNNVDFLASGTTDFRPIGVAAFSGWRGPLRDGLEYLHVLGPGREGWPSFEINLPGQITARCHAARLACCRWDGKKFSASPADLIHGAETSRAKRAVDCPAPIERGRRKERAAVDRAFAGQVCPPPARWGRDLGVGWNRSRAGGTPGHCRGRCRISEAERFGGKRPTTRDAPREQRSIRADSAVEGRGGERSLSCGDSVGTKAAPWNPLAS